MNTEEEEHMEGSTRCARLFPKAHRSNAQQRIHTSSQHHAFMYLLHSPMVTVHWPTHFFVSGGGKTSHGYLRTLYAAASVSA